MQNTSEWLKNNGTTIGCFIVVLASVCLALSIFLKSKADRASVARNTEAKSIAKRHYIFYGLALVACGGWIAFGIVLLNHAADEPVKRLEKLQHDTFDQSGKMRLEMTEKLQVVLERLNAAKQEDSKKVTEEKMAALQSNLLQWADDFASNLPAEKSRFAQEEIALQKELRKEDLTMTQSHTQISGQSYPVFLFAIRFLQESVRAYAKKLGDTNIVSTL